MKRCKRIQDKERKTTAGEVSESKWKHFQPAPSKRKKERPTNAPLLCQNFPVRAKTHSGPSNDTNSIEPVILSVWMKQKTT